MSGKYVLGIDIGGTNFRIGLVDENYNLEHFHHFKTKDTFRGVISVDNADANAVTAASATAAAAAGTAVNAISEAKAVAGATTAATAET